MTTYTYHDTYLERHCTIEREARAIADVAAIGTFPAAWSEPLVVPRTYILACQENQAKEDDLYAIKLKTYRAEFDGLLPKAQAAAAAEAGEPSSLSVFSIPLERA